MKKKPDLTPGEEVGLVEFNTLMARLPEEQRGDVAMMFITAGVHFVMAYHGRDFARGFMDSARAVCDGPMLLRRPTQQ